MTSKISRYRDRLEKLGGWVEKSPVLINGMMPSVLILVFLEQNMIISVV